MLYIRLRPLLTTSIWILRTLVTFHSIVAPYVLQGTQTRPAVDRRRSYRNDVTSQLQRGNDKHSASSIIKYQETKGSYARVLPQLGRCKLPTGSQPDLPYSVRDAALNDNIRVWAVPEDPTNTSQESAQEAAGSSTSSNFREPMSSKTAAGSCCAFVFLPWVLLGLVLRITVAQVIGVEHCKPVAVSQHQVIRDHANDGLAAGNSDGDGSAGGDVGGSGLGSGGEEKFRNARSAQAVTKVYGRGQYVRKLQYKAPRLPTQAPSSLPPKQVPHLYFSPMVSVTSLAQAPAPNLQPTQIPTSSYFMERTLATLPSFGRGPPPVDSLPIPNIQPLRNSPNSDVTLSELYFGYYMGPPQTEPSSSQVPSSPPPLQGDYSQNGLGSDDYESFFPRTSFSSADEKVFSTVAVLFIVAFFTLCIIIRILYNRRNSQQRAQNGTPQRTFTTGGASSQPRTRDGNLQQRLDQLPCVTVTAEQAQMVVTQRKEVQLGNTDDVALREAGGKLDQGGSQSTSAQYEDTTATGDTTDVGIGAAEIIGHLESADKHQAWHDNLVNGGFGGSALQPGTAGETLRSRETGSEGEFEGATWLEEPCVVCMEKWEEGATVLILPCMHRLHQVCAQRWAQAQQSQHKVCPICKQPMLLER